MFTLPVSDHIDSAVVGQFVKIKGHRRMSKVDWHVKNVIVGWHVVIFG